jgi:hypothetical protein
MTTHLVTRCELRRVRVADHVADVVGDDLGILDAELVQDAGEIASLRGLRVAVLGMGRQAHATQVGNHDGVILDERPGERRPHVAGVAETVEQNDRRPGAADADILSPAAHRHLLGAERGRPGTQCALDRCCTRYCHGRHVRQRRRQHKFQIRAGAETTHRAILLKVGHATLTHPGFALLAKSGAPGAKQAKTNRGIAAQQPFGGDASMSVTSWTE